MNKEFIPYEQALELKELGFDEPCFGYYYTLDGKDWKFADDKQYDSLDEFYNIGSKFTISAPLYQQVFRFFREKYELQAEVLWRGDMECFCYKTGKFKYGSHDFSKDDYTTYEEAELACLKKLIEIEGGQE